MMNPGMGTWSGPGRRAERFPFESKPTDEGIERLVRFSGELRLREGGAQVLVRIHRCVVDVNFVVDVRAGAASALPDETDHVAALHVLPDGDGKARHVT